MYRVLAAPAPVVLYPFRYRDPLTGGWVRARYLADLNEIAARYDRWEIVGAPETRWPTQGWFSPHR
jgi:hypothetical protein